MTSTFVGRRLRARRALLIASSALSAAALPSAALAQTVPQYVTPDRNGVDLTTGLPWLSFEEGGIGSGPGRVAMQRFWATGAGWVDNWSGGLFTAPFQIGASSVHVQLGGISETFTSFPNQGTFYNQQGTGSTLTLEGTTYVLTERDGTRIEYPDQPFNLQTSYCAGADPGSCRIPTTVTKPNGIKFNLVWDSAILSSGTFKRLASVTSSAGYSLTVTYATNSPGTGTQPVTDWYKRTIVAFNNSAQPISPPPTITYAYPSSTVVTVTDPANRTWRLTTSSNGQLTGVRMPGSNVDDITYAYGTGGTVSSATNEAIASTYQLTTPGTGQPYMTVTNALGKTVKVTIATNGRPASYEDQLHRITQFGYDSSNRLNAITAPLLNSVQYLYDSRGNVTDTTYFPKSGSGTIATHADFDTTCANTKTCNQPNWTRDANGDVTNYSYDPTHGGVTSIRPPKANSAAVQPGTDIKYTSITSATGDAVWMPTKVWACQTTDAGTCETTADESRTTYQYNTNLLPGTIVSGDGTGGSTTTATSVLGHDARGNVTSYDGPLANDTWAFKYDAADQQVGVISPDPDGTTGPMKYRAVRTTYLPNGQVSMTEVGTTLGQSDANFNAIVVSQTGQTYFDSSWRPNMYRLLGGTTRERQTQYSYDGLGRLLCTAVRMDRNQFTNDVALDACTLGTNSGDKDRITKQVYDDASELVQTRVAYGVTGAHGVADQTLSYTGNGKLEYLIDGEGQKSQLVYDPFDRLSQQVYPSTVRPSAYDDTTQATALSSAGAVDAADYDGYTYDNAGNVLSHHLRSGSSIGLTYDHLDRLIFKDLTSTENDVTYRYDNLNRLTAAFQTDSTGATVQTVKFTWDALSNNIDQTGPRGIVHSDYDLAGERLKLTYPGSGLDVSYDYFNTGEMKTLTENKGAPAEKLLATYAYDDLGDRTSLTLGNGEVTTYTYDPISRLASQNIDFPGTANDLLIGSMTYNPASQLTSVNRSNDAYAWTASGSGSTTYQPNGKNQYSLIAGVAPTYDTNGNLKTEPQSAKNYLYSSENLLKSVSGGGIPAATLTYDPVMRLYEDQSTTSGAASQFVYDGTDMVAEYDQSNALQKRYVFGASDDEPLVQLDAAGNRTWLTGDERGSIIAQSDDSGNVTQINKYDEFGKPQPGNLGRFQYTGQSWLDDLGTSPASGQGLYYYKTRMYAPHIGRFMQPDAAGYAGDGLNLYAYVTNDPVNLLDRTGLETSDDQTVTACRNGGEPPDCVQPSDTSPTPASFGVQTVVQSPPLAPVVVIGHRRNSPLSAVVWKYAQKLGQCTADQYGLGAVGLGLAGFGQPIPGTKRFVTEGSSRGTSLAGMAADAIFGSARSPIRLPSLVGSFPKFLTGRALGYAGTKSIARFAGRAVPIVGEALIAYDAASIAICTAE